MYISIQLSLRVSAHVKYRNLLFEIETTRDVDMDNKDVELTKTIKSGQQQQIVCIQKSGFGSHCMNNLPPPPKYYLKRGMKHMCIDGYCWLAADVGTEFLVRTEMFSPKKKLHSFPISKEACRCLRRWGR